MKQQEHNEQVAVFAWARWAEAQYPELALLFAVPNGGARNKVTAARLKAEGVKRGVLDIWFPVARGGWRRLRRWKTIWRPGRRSWGNLKTGPAIGRQPLDLWGKPIIIMISS